MNQMQIIYELSFSEAYEFSKDLIENGMVPILISHPGVGKTQLVLKLQEELGYDMVMNHLSTQEPTDWSGVYSPDKSQDFARVLPLEHTYKLTKAEKETLLFFDDFGQSDEQTQAAVMQFLLGGKLNGIKLPKNVMPIIATNDVGQNAGVGNIISPVLGRGFIVRIKPDVKDWAFNYAQFNEDIPTKLIGATLFNKRWIEEHNFNPSNPTEPVPSPRNVTELGKALTKFGNEYEGSMRNALYYSRLGHAGMVEMVTYERALSDIPNISTIFKNPDDVRVPEELGKRYALANALFDRTVQVEHMYASLKYLDRTDRELKRFYMHSIANRKPHLGEQSSEVAQYIVNRK